MRYLLWKLHDMSSEVKSPKDLDLHGLGAVGSMTPDKDFVAKGLSFECSEILDSSCDWGLILLRDRAGDHGCFGVDE